MPQHSHVEFWQGETTIFRCCGRPAPILADPPPVRDHLTRFTNYGARPRGTPGALSGWVAREEYGLSRLRGITSVKTLS